MSDGASEWTAGWVALQLFEKGLITENDYNELLTMEGFYDNTYDNPAAEAVRKILSKNGYDGIVYENLSEDAGSYSLIALYPEQIVTVAENGILKENSGVSRAISDGEVAFSMPMGIEKHSVEKYNEEQYNSFGWVRYNDVLSTSEYSILLSRYIDYKHNKNKYPTTRFGEAVIHSSECPDVLMYVKGDIDSPQITKIVRISIDEYNASVIKEELLHYEYRQIPIPYKNVEIVYGEEVLNIYKKQDFISFRGYSTRSKGIVGEENSNFDKRKFNRTGSIGENTDVSRADSVDESNLINPINNSRDEVELSQNNQKEAISSEEIASSMPIGKQENANNQTTSVENFEYKRYNDFDTYFGENLHDTSQNLKPSGEQEWQVFCRSFANKTTNIHQGDFKIITIFTADNYYIINADGYMSGTVLCKNNIDEYNEKEQIFNDDTSTNIFATYDEGTWNRERNRDYDGDTFTGGIPDTFDVELDEFIAKHPEWFANRRESYADYKRRIEATSGDGVAFSFPIGNRKNINENLKINANINFKILGLIEKVKSGMFKGNDKEYLNNPTSSVAKKIKELTNIDVRDFKVAIEARQIERILKDHGENGITDRSMSNDSDIAKMEYVLNSPDSIVKSGTTQAYVTVVNGKNKPANTVLYEKYLDNNSYYVVQAVPDTKAKTLYIVTAFIGKKLYKKEALQTNDAKSPVATPKSENAKTSINSITKINDNVNNDYTTDTDMFEGGIENTDITSGDETEFSIEYTEKLLSSFGITKLGDYIHVQKRVMETLENEDFFTDKENRCIKVVNDASGVVVEINKKGIKETFDEKNYANVGRIKKIAKLMTIRNLVEIIRFGELQEEGVRNTYKGTAKNKSFAYIRHTVNIDGKAITVQIDVKKSPEKNKFWVHKIIKIYGANTKNVDANNIPNNVKAIELGQTIVSTDKMSVSQESKNVNNIEEFNVQEVAYVEEICNKLGRKVVFEDLRGMVYEGEIISPDGYIEKETGIIHLNTYAKNPIGFVLKHELTHYSEKAKGYLDFVNEVKQSGAYQKWITEKMGESNVRVAEYKYKQNVAKTNVDIYSASDLKAQTEMIADFVGDMLFTENGSGMVAMASDIEVKHRNKVIQFVLDFISYLKERIVGIDSIALELSRLEDRFNELLFDARNNDSVYDNDIRFSFSGSRGSEILYNTPKEFMPESEQEWSVFNRQFSNKTSRLKKGERKNIIIHTASNVYFIQATGYLEGCIQEKISIYDNEEFISNKIKEHLDGTFVIGKTFYSSIKGKRSRDGRRNRDINSIEERYRQSQNVDLDERQSASDDVGYYWENYGYQTWEELIDAIDSGVLIIDENGEILEHASEEAIKATSKNEVAFSMPIGNRKRNANNVIELSKDNELSNKIGDLRGAAKYKVIQQYILDVLSGEEIVLSDGKIAVVDKSDALHIANKSGYQKTAEISAIKEIVEKAVLIAEEESNKARKFDYFYYYEATVKYDDEIFNIYLNVGRATNDKRYHLYDITQKLRDTAHRINDVGRPKPNEGYALETVSLNNIVSQTANNVNNDYTTKTDTFDGIAKSDTQGNAVDKKLESAKFVENFIRMGYTDDEISALLYKVGVLDDQSGSGNGDSQSDRSILQGIRYNARRIGESEVNRGETGSIDGYNRTYGSHYELSNRRVATTYEEGEGTSGFLEQGVRGGISAPSVSGLVHRGISKNEATLETGVASSIAIGKRHDANISINKSQIKAIEKICNSFGIQVVFEDLREMVYRGETISPDGYELNGVIHLNLYAQNPIGFVLKHELTHYSEKAKGYLNFAEQVKCSSAYQKWITEKMGESNVRVAEYKYKQNVAKTNVDIYSASDLKAQTEMIADFVGDMLFTENGSGMVAMASDIEVKHRNKVIQFVLDFISHLKKKLVGQNHITSELSKLENNFKRILSEATHTDGSYNNEISFSFGVTQEDINNYVDLAYSKENTQDYKKYAVPTQRLINDVADEIDIAEYSHALRDNDIRHIKNSHGENTNEKYPVTRDDLKLIPWIVQNYDKVFVVKRENNRIGIIYVKVNEQGLLYFLEQVTTKYGNELLLVNKQMIKTGIDNIPNLKGLVDAINKKQSETEFLADLKKVHEVYAQSVNQPHSIISISKITNNVNNDYTTKTDISDDVEKLDSQEMGYVEQISENLGVQGVFEDLREKVYEDKIISPDGYVAKNKGNSISKNNGKSQYSNDNEVKFSSNDKSLSGSATLSDDVNFLLNKNVTESIIEDNIVKVITMDSVADLTGEEFEKGYVDLITQVENFFNSVGNIAKSKYGDVELTRVGIKASLGHGIGRKKAIAFKAVPNVIKYGEVINYQKNWKNRGYDTAVFAAPITIDAKKYFLAAVINVEFNKNSCYLHEVALQKVESNASFKTGTIKNGTPSDALPSIYTLLQKLQVVNENTLTVTDNSAHKTLDIKEQSYIEDICNKLKIKVVFEDLREMVYKGEIISPDGYVEKETGIIHLNTYAKNPIGFVFKHELTHYSEKAKGYLDFVNEVKQSGAYQKWITEKMGESNIRVAEYKYKQKLLATYVDIESISNLKIEAEMIADFVGDMLFTENGSGMVALTVDLDTKKRNAFVQWLIDFISYLKTKLFGQKYMALELSVLEDGLRRLIIDASHEYASMEFDNETEVNRTIDDAHKATLVNVGSDISFCFAHCDDEELVSKAKEMEENGEDGVDIYKQLGVFKNVFGDWVSEIKLDRFMFFPYGNSSTKNNLIAERGQIVGRLRDLVVWPDLYEKFPEFENVKVVIRESPFSYDKIKFIPEKNFGKIIINKKLCDEYRAKKDKSAKEHIVNAIQRMIQFSEGHYIGRNYDYWKALEEKGKLPFSNSKGRYLTAKDMMWYFMDNYDAQMASRRQYIKDYITYQGKGKRDYRNDALYLPYINSNDVIVYDKRNRLMALSETKEEKAKASKIAALKQKQIEEEIEKVQIKETGETTKKIKDLVWIKEKKHSVKFRQKFSNIKGGNSGAFEKSEIAAERRFENQCNIISKKPIADLDTIGRAVHLEIRERANGTIVANNQGELTSVYALSLSGDDVFKQLQKGLKLGTIDSLIESFNDLDIENISSNKIKIFEFFAIAKAPIRLKSEPSKLTTKEICKQLVDDGYLTKGEYSRVMRADSANKQITTGFKSLLIEKGFDSIVYENQKYDKGSMTLIVLNESQLIPVAKDGILIEDNGVEDLTYENYASDENMRVDGAQENKEKLTMYIKEPEYDLRTARKQVDSRIKMGDAGCFEKTHLSSEEAYEYVRNELEKNFNKELSGYDKAGRKFANKALKILDKCAFRDENGDILTFSLWNTKPKNISQAAKMGIEFGSVNSAFKKFFAKKDGNVKRYNGVFEEFILNCCAPLILPFDSWNSIEMADYLLDKKMITKSFYEKIRSLRSMNSPTYISDAAQKLQGVIKRIGYDCIVFAKSTGEKTAVTLYDKLLIPISQNGILNQDCKLYDDAEYKENNDYKASGVIEPQKATMRDFSKVKDIILSETSATKKLKHLTEFLSYSSNSILEENENIKVGFSGIFENISNNFWNFISICNRFTKETVTETNQNDTAGRYVEDEIRQATSNTKFKDKDGRLLSFFFWNKYGDFSFKHSALGYNLTTLEGAHNDYLAEREKHPQIKTGEYVECYVKASRVYVLKNPLTELTPKKLAEELYKSGALSRYEYTRATTLINNDATNHFGAASKYINRKMKEKGYDCIIYMDSSREIGGIGVIVFDQWQFIPVSVNGQAIENNVEKTYDIMLDGAGDVEYNKNIGLTLEQKQKIREKTGWSDGIINYIRSMEEAQIYINADLKEAEVNGRKCLLRSDIDLEQIDYRGKTNYERIMSGKSPVNIYGEVIVLHHIGQKQESPFAELTRREHEKNDRILHRKKEKSKINRNIFWKERKTHWKIRLNKGEIYE